MTPHHQRLSVSSLCSLRWTFEEDLELWERLGVRQVGLLGPKVEAYGHARAVNDLRAGGFSASCVVAGTFDLRRPETWEGSRAAVNRHVEVAAALGADCTYITTGRTTGGTWDEVLATFTEAVGPCVTAAEASGVRLALEPSQRTQVSFVRTISDAIDVADRTGLAIVADLGNCWAERDVESAIRRAGDRLALVQLADVIIGTYEAPGPDGRVMPGDGELPVERFLQATIDAGYTGPVELEVLGPVVEAEGYEPAIRRGIEWSSQLLARLPFPPPPRSGA